VASVERSNLDPTKFGDLPCIRITQGDLEIVELSFDDREFLLTLAITIIAGRSEENIETSLNKLHRNMLVELNAASFDFELTERTIVAPVIIQPDGQVCAALETFWQARFEQA